MNSASLERWQAERLFKHVQQELHYLDRLEGRMHQKHFPANDPLYEHVKKAHRDQRAVDSAPSLARQSLRSGKLQGFRIVDRLHQLRSLVADVPDRFSDRPRLHLFARELAQHRLQFCGIADRWIEPVIDRRMRQDDRHAVVELTHHVVRLGRADCAAIDRAFG